MGHSPGFPCVMEPDDHEGRCSTQIPDDFVDLGKTLWFEVDGEYWRTNRTAPRGYEVEFQRPDGSWANARAFPTEALFLAEMAGRWRQLEPEEAARLAGGGA